MGTTLAQIPQAVEERPGIVGTMIELPGLSTRQSELLEAVLPGAQTIEDHSWGLVETTVLELQHPTGRFILKAGGVTDRHIAREIRAHANWLAPWTATGHAPALFYADDEAKMVITHYLPGALVEGHPSQEDPETFRQAGVLLAAFHRQHHELDPDAAARSTQRARQWLDRPHRISASVQAELRAEIADWPTTAPTVVVPTHGDWQPRNWLICDGQIRVIDFGRCDLRPAVDDIARLARQDFARDPDLETAFFDGYGHDPREPELWRRTLLNEAIGTAAWAYGVGDETFEQLGHRQLNHLLGHDE